MKKVLGVLHLTFKHPLAKGGVVVFAGTMVANALAYLYHLVVGRILGPVGYGELAALLSLSYILNVFTVMLQTVVAKFVSERAAKNQTGEIRAFILYLTGVLVIIGVLCALILFVIATPIASFLHVSDSMVIVYLFLGSLFTLIGMVFSSVLQGMQRFFQGMVILNTNSALRLAAGAVFASFGVTAALKANAVALFVAALIALWAIRDVIRVQTRGRKIAIAPLFAGSTLSFLAVLGVSVLNSQDVIVVKHFLSATEAGWYGALSTMGKIIFFASYSVGYVLLPIVSDRSSKGAGSSRLVYASLGIVAVLSFGITAGFFLFPELALELLYGRAFISAAPYLGLFAVFSSLYTISYTLVMGLLGSGKSAVWRWLVGAAIMQDVLLAFFHKGISMVIWINIAVSVTLLIVLLLYYRRVFYTKDTLHS